VNLGIINVSNAKEKLSAAESNLAIEEQTLILKQAGATEQQINAQKANIDAAKSNMKKTKAELAKSFVYSPINGVVSKQDAKIGEIVSANIPLISLISKSDFKIEANVPEADIAKIKINDLADVVFDAYGDDIVFQAKVASIEPGETVVEGVATYKVVLMLNKDDERIKQGMTANINILTAFLENVIAVPVRAVIEKNNKKIVKILDENNEVAERVVKTGVRGSHGNIEIVEGLSVGDRVIIFSL